MIQIKNVTLEDVDLMVVPVFEDTLTKESGLKPLFEDLSDSVKAKIFDRMKYLGTTEFSQ